MKTKDQQAQAARIIIELPFLDATNPAIVAQLLKGLRTLIRSTDFTYEVREDFQPIFLEAAADGDDGLMIGTYLAASREGAIPGPSPQLRQILESALLSHSVHAEVNSLFKTLKMRPAPDSRID